MTKVDQLIKKFKEFKEELNKNVNQSYSPAPNATTGTSGGQGGMYRSDGIDQMALCEAIKFEKNGQWKLDKVDPEENVNIPHPQVKAKMAIGINKKEDGCNRTASPKEVMSDPRGKIHMIKGDKILVGTGTNDENTGPGRNSGHGAL